MANITYVTFGKLQPIFTTAPQYNSTHQVPVGDNLILLIEEQNYSAHQYRTTSTICLMIFAWTLLIVGVMVCCCSQCFGAGQRKRRGGINGGIGETSSSSCSTTSYNGDRTNPSEPVEICRRYGPDFEAESLPSYTIVSGLPTYDDALEEFRKAGIILTPTATPTPVIKIFESDSKDNQTFYNLESGLNNDNISGDNISLSSTCTCGASAAANSATPTPNNSYSNLGPQSQVIELSPEQLATLSQKRLSLQIAFNNNINPVRRNSRPRVDLYREVINRNSILRSRAVGNTAGLDASIFPTIHRSSSTFSLANPNGPRLHHHRGSLC